MDKALPIIALLTLTACQTTKPDPIDVTPMIAAHVDGERIEVVPVKDRSEPTSRFGYTTTPSAKETNFADPRKPKKQEDKGTSVTVSFRDAPIRDIVRFVLADTLRKPYTLAPTVAGTATLEAPRPIKRSALLPMLETALANVNAAISERDGVFHIQPNTAATKGVAPLTKTAPSTGNAAYTVTLSHMTAERIAALITPFTPESSIVEPVTHTNSLVISGPADAVRNLAETAKAFDEDWLSGMSIALQPIKNGKAGEIAQEVRQLFEEQHGEKTSSLVRLIAIERLNAVLTVSHNARYLKAATEWIGRLDQQSELEPHVTVRRMHHAKAKPTAEALSALIVDDEKGSRIIADEETNTLIIRANAKEREQIETALRQMDQRPTQVLIEATIAEVTLTDDLRYGLQWFLDSADLGLGDAFESRLSNASTGILETAGIGFSLVAPGANAAKLILSALDEVTTVNVLSSPMLMVRNNQPASLQVGNQVPVSTRQSQQTITTDAPIVNNIEFRDTGIILKVTPRANRNGELSIDIDQEISSVARTAGTGTLTPTISQRRITSSVVVDSGSTVLLGGLISDESTSARSGTPILHDIPVIGSAFGRTETQGTRTELIVLIKPTLLRTKTDVDSARDEIGRKLRTIRGLSDSRGTENERTPAP